MWKISDFVTFSSTNSDALLGRVLISRSEIRDSQTQKSKQPLTTPPSVSVLSTALVRRRHLLHRTPPTFSFDRSVTPSKYRFKICASPAAFVFRRPKLSSSSALASLTVYSPLVLVVIAAPASNGPARYHFVSTLLSYVVKPSTPFMVDNTTAQIQNLLRIPPSSLHPQVFSNLTSASKPKRRITSSYKQS